MVTLVLRSVLDDASATVLPESLEDPLHGRTNDLITHGREIGRELKSVRDQLSSLLDCSLVVRPALLDDLVDLYQRVRRYGPGRRADGRTRWWWRSRWRN